VSEAGRRWVVSIAISGPWIGQIGNRSSRSVVALWPDVLVRVGSVARIFSCAEQV
jgi:hypothetical protein